MGVYLYTKYIQYTHILSRIWREDSNAEWVLTDLLNILADKTREGEVGSEQSKQ